MKNTSPESAIKHAAEVIIKAMEAKTQSEHTMHIIERSADAIPTLTDLIEDAEQCASIMRGIDLITDCATKFLTAINDPNDRAYFAALLTLHSLTMHEARAQIDNISDGLQVIYEQGEDNE